MTVTSSLPLEIGLSRCVSRDGGGGGVECVGVGV